MRNAQRRLRILVLSWNYPTPAAPQRGLWVQRMCDAAATRADISAIVPTPWVPPLLPMQSLARILKWLLTLKKEKWELELRWHERAHLVHHWLLERFRKNIL